MMTYLPLDMKPSPGWLRTSAARRPRFPAHSPTRTFAWACLGIVAWTASTVSIAAATPSAELVKLEGVPFTQVEITDRFWQPRRETNRLVSIPVNFKMLEESGNIRNLELAAAKATEGFTGPVFMDSDIYKALEAAAYTLATHRDPALEKEVDRVIAAAAGAQQPNGYLNSYFTVKEPTKRWTNLRDWHELYCAGHLFEAAVAHFQATGKRTFLEVAIRLADHIDSVFGSAPGKRMGYPGHPEIELALVKLSRVTGERRYFELARFFVENRGRRFFAEEHHTPLNEYDGAYWQDDIPICEHRNIKGHAVRAAYLLSGATDIVRGTGNPDLLRMIHRVWRNTTERNMYLTGGIGPSAHNEGFTVDYDLPNQSAYQETCATIALAQWNHRLALLHADATYADVMERALYNGVLSGVSQDGNKFFYVNPLSSAGSHHRSAWFGCACCPPNVARTLAFLGGYAYATSANDLYVNLYIQGRMRAQVAGAKVALAVTTDYPWDGRVQVQTELDRPARFALHLRVPSWCAGASLKVNRKAVASGAAQRGYLVVEREWRDGDRVDLDLPMPVRRVAANPEVKGNAGLLALQRGPIVYCLEACDQSEPISSLYLPIDAELKIEREPKLLGGVTVIKGLAAVVDPSDWKRKLYQTAPVPRRVAIQAIPYYAWDNREPGAMQVWLPIAPPAPVTGGPERSAKVSISFKNSNCSPEAVNDGITPKSSADHPGVMCHWWPHKGQTEWVQYTWTKPTTFGGTKVYWFDDTGHGACRLPTEWEVQYLDNDSWKPVKALSHYPAKLDQWCEVKFEPVTTTALRLAARLQTDWAAGVHEWKVIEADEE